MANPFGPTIEQATAAAQERTRQRMLDIAQLDQGGLSAMAGLVGGRAIGEAIGGALGVDMRPPEVVQAERNSALQAQFEANYQQFINQGMGQADALEASANSMQLPLEIDRPIRAMIDQQRESEFTSTKEKLGIKETRQKIKKRELEISALPSKQRREEQTFALQQRRAQQQLKLGQLQIDKLRKEVARKGPAELNKPIGDTTKYFNFRTGQRPTDETMAVGDAMAQGFRQATAKEIAGYQTAMSSMQTLMGLRNMIIEDANSGVPVPGFAGANLSLFIPKDSPFFAFGEPSQLEQSAAKFMSNMARFVSRGTINIDRHINDRLPFFEAIRGTITAQARNLEESGVMTDKDRAIYEKTVPKPLVDSRESALEKINKMIDQLAERMDYLLPKEEFMGMFQQAERRNLATSQDTFNELSNQINRYNVGPNQFFNQPIP